MIKVGTVCTGIGSPDSFIKPVSDTQLYKQAGNTITKTVIKEIIRNLLLNE